jgi:anti-anti-sigma regulatory factor
MLDCHSSPPPRSTSSQSDAVWRIEGPLVIATVADWHRRLREQLAATPSLTLDLSGLTAIDVFGLQLLWSARRSATAHFILVNPPAAFAQACTANGFASLPSS